MCRVSDFELGEDYYFSEQTFPPIAQESRRIRTSRPIRKLRSSSFLCYFDIPGRNILITWAGLITGTSMLSRANHGGKAGDVLFIAFATTPKNSPLIIRYGRHSRRFWWAGWVPTPLPSKGTVLQTAEFADSLYLPICEGAFIYTGLPLPLSPGPVRLGGSNRKLLFVCLYCNCFASASLKNRISPLFYGATAVIVDFSYF